MKSSKNKSIQPSKKARRAKEILGKIALVGLTYIREGQPPERKQFYGKVTEVKNKRILLELHGSHETEIFSLPPGINAFEYAKPGYYRFRSSDEGVENPDFLVTYTIYPNKKSYIKLTSSQVPPKS
jgi:hypothetical protein